MRRGRRRRPHVAPAVERQQQADDEHGQAEGKVSAGAGSRSGGRRAAAGARCRWRRAGTQAGLPAAQASLYSANTQPVPGAGLLRRSRAEPCRGMARAASRLPPACAALRAPLQQSRAAAAASTAALCSWRTTRLHEREGEGSASCDLLVSPGRMTGLGTRHRGERGGTAPRRARASRSAAGEHAASSASFGCPCR
jgi:hypothetical protein